jgi:hypothetical protein
MEEHLISQIKKLHSAYINYESWASRVKDLLCYLELWPIGHSSPPAYAPSSEGGGAVEASHSNYFDAECRKRLKAATVIRSFLSDALYPKYMAERFDDPELLWEQIRSDAKMMHGGGRR